MIYLRSLLFNVLCYGTIAAGCIFNSVIGVFSKKATIFIWNHSFIPLVVFWLRWVAGIRIEIRGRECLRQKNVIYAVKHESALETYVLSNFIKRATFILKKELTYIPIFGWAAYFYGMIAVDRSAGARAMKKMLKDAEAQVKDERPIIIFPEGTRMAPGKTGEYKPGLAFLYQNIQIPVIPVAINTGMFWRKNSFLRHPGTVIFEFMEPMPEGLPKKEFMESLQQRIESKCAELNAETVKKYPETAVMLKGK